jgi:tetratricopeptide (TPR) repeat protein
MTISKSDYIRQHVKEGRSLYSSGQYQQAADIFGHAAEEYANLGQHTLAAEMKNNQCVAHLKLKQPQQAYNAVKGTPTVFKEAGDINKLAMSLANKATALMDLGDNEQALEIFSQAATFFLQIDETDMHLQVMQSISTIKLKSRNFYGAIFSMLAGLEGVKKPSLRQRILIQLLKIPRGLLGR